MTAGAMMMIVAFVFIFIESKSSLNATGKEEYSQLESTNTRISSTKMIIFVKLTFTAMAVTREQ